MSGSEKKMNKNTYDISSIKRNQEVSESFTLYSCKTTAKKCTKKVCCTCKVALLLIRPIVAFSPFSFPSPLKGDVTHDDSHRCNVATLCCAKNRHCESFRVTSPLALHDYIFCLSKL